jgi:pimeloyl-ACP methyl ester carboxylesterase
MMIRSSTYKIFLECVSYFRNNPVTLSSINGYDENFAERILKWWPLDWAKSQEFNPMGIIAKTKIPILAIYGGKDTQVDPQQGANAYRQNLNKAGNPFYEIKTFPDADHNMMLAETGCLMEQKERKQWKIVPGLTDYVAGWLKKLNKHLEEREL